MAEKELKDIPVHKVSAAQMVLRAKEAMPEYKGPKAKKATKEIPAPKARKVKKVTL